MKVWMLIFDCCDFANFNGVFSTREKGIEAFFTLCKQNNKYWSNPWIEECDEDWVLLDFTYQDETSTIADFATLTKIELDKIQICANCTNLFFGYFAY